MYFYFSDFSISTYFISAISIFLQPCLTFTSNTFIFNSLHLGLTQRCWNRLQPSQQSIENEELRHILFHYKL